MFVSIWYGLEALMNLVISKNPFFFEIICLLEKFDRYCLMRSKHYFKNEIKNVISFTQPYEIKYFTTN